MSPISNSNGEVRVEVTSRTSSPAAASEDGASRMFNGGGAGGGGNGLDYQGRTHARIFVRIFARIFVRRARPEVELLR